MKMTGSFQEDRNHLRIINKIGKLRDVFQHLTGATRPVLLDVRSVPFPLRYFNPGSFQLLKRNELSSADRMYVGMPVTKQPGPLHLARSNGLLNAETLEQLTIISEQLLYPSPKFIIRTIAPGKREHLPLVLAQGIQLRSIPFEQPRRSTERAEGTKFLSTTGNREAPDAMIQLLGTPPRGKVTMAPADPLSLT